jgi:hypothetical protein
MRLFYETMISTGVFQPGRSYPMKKTSGIKVKSRVRSGGIKWPR